MYRGTHAHTHAHTHTRTHTYTHTHTHTKRRRKENKDVETTPKTLRKIYTKKKKDEKSMEYITKNKVITVTKNIT